MLKAVIFDMDGLMIDSEVVTYEGYALSLKKRGYKDSRDFYTTTLGTRPKMTCEMYKKQYGDDIPFYEMLEEVHEYMENVFETRGIPLKKGLIPLLEYLKENNYKAIVATSSHKDRVMKIFDKAHLHQYFDDYICGDEVENGKPNPEIFIKACKKLGVDPCDAIVLEDSEMGIQASYDANIPVICIPDMKYPSDKYANMTFKIVESLLDVLDYIKELK